MGPHTSLVIGLLGGLIFAPLFGAVCAAIGQYRYRRAMAVKLGKPFSAIPKRANTPLCQEVMVFGIMVCCFCGMASDPNSVRSIPESWEIMLGWLSIIALISALAAAIRLAKVGMPPEANFRLRADVGVDVGVDIEENSPKMAHAGKPAMPAAGDLFDSREV